MAPAYLRGSSRTGAKEASQKPALEIPLKLERRHGTQEAEKEAGGRKEQAKTGREEDVHEKPELPGRGRKMPVSGKISPEIHGIRDIRD